MSPIVSTGFGLSTNESPIEAGREAAYMAIKKLKRPCLTLVFASPTYRELENVLKGVRSVVGEETPLAGSTTGAAGGVNLTHKGFISNSVAILMFESDHLRVGCGVAENVSKDPRASGRKAAINAVKALNFNPYSELADVKISPSLVKHSPFTVMMMDDGYQGASDYEIRGIVDVVGRAPIVGGTAGDDGTLGKSLVFCDGKAYSDALVTVIFAGNVKIGFGCAVGYTPISGKMAVVTKGDNYRDILQLNGKPAAKVYAEWTGIDLNELEKNIVYQGCVNPLGVIDELYPDYVWLRHPSVYIKENDGLRVGGMVPVHQTVHLMETKAEDIIRTNVEKLREAISYGNIKDVAAIIGFNCVERYELLSYIPDAGKKAIDALVSVVGKDVPIIGNGGAWGEQMFCHTGNVGVQNLTLCFLVIGNEKVE